MMIINTENKICDFNKCTGCGLCAYLCPKHVISFSLQGLHYIPTVDEELCVNCGECINNCPVNSPVEKNFIQNCYAAWSRDDKIHNACSSGGIATEFYLNFIKTGGYVVGCAYDEKLNVRYIVTNHTDDLVRFYGSKYVASFFPAEAYQKIVDLLSKGIKVLFIGLPCHCDALKKLCKGDEKLYLIDLLCRGSNSPKVWHEYLSVQEKKLGKIQNASFRGGNYDCWMCLFGENNDLLYKRAQYIDEYFFTFMKHSALRPSCYSCRYACERRVGDVTLGDFWGLDEAFIDAHHIEHGVNVVLVNTPKGQELFQSLNERIDFFERPWSEAVSGNDTLRMPTAKPADYDFLSAKYRKYGFWKAIHRYDRDYIAQLRSLRHMRIKYILGKLIRLCLMKA